MSTLNVTGSATNSAGASSPFSGVISVVDPPTIVSVSVVPASAPAGTLRTITVVATDPQNLPLTYACQVGGVNATPVTGQPGKFTFTA